MRFHKKLKNHALAGVWALAVGIAVTGCSFLGGDSRKFGGKDRQEPTIITSESGIEEYTEEESQIRIEIYEESGQEQELGDLADMPDGTAGIKEGKPEGELPEEKIEEEPEEVLILPERYDYREEGRMPTAGDQGNLGTCWAFSSLHALETTLLPEEQWDFSEDHMSRRNSFGLRQQDGGQYAISMAYLLAWQGPVTEAEDPYGDGRSPEKLLPSKHVQEIRILESKNYDRIKRAVYQTGGVQSSLFTRMQNSSSTDPYYNREHFSYYYPGGEKSNHNVVIIGWDDHYPKENFDHLPEDDGAFICLNSWGANFGEEGCFYVSYYDTNIGDVNVLYSGITDTDYYTGIYQSDLCGWIGQVGYGREDAYFTNAYYAEKTEKLKAAGFYATMPQTSYQVYAQAGISTPEELVLDKPLASGVLEDAGFYTVEFSEEILLQQGEKFWVVIKIQTPGAVHPVAIEYRAPDNGKNADLSDGEGYLSADGQFWVSAEENQNCNLCLKAYTGP